MALAVLAVTPDGSLARVNGAPDPPYCSSAPAPPPLTIGGGNATSDAVLGHHHSPGEQEQHPGAAGARLLPTPGLLLSGGCL